GNHIVTVVSNNRYFATGVGHPEIGRGTAVNNPKTHTISCFKLGKLLFARAVYQKLFVINITNVHSFHTLPFIHYFCFKMTCLDCLGVALYRILLDTKPIVARTQHTLYMMRVEIRPFTQNHRDGRYVVNSLPKATVILAFLKNDSTIHAYLFLKARVAVVPIGTILLYRETISVRRPFRYGHLGKKRYTVFPIGQLHTMPMYGRAFFKLVVHDDFGGVTFCKCQCRHRNLSIDRYGVSFFSTVVNHCIGHIQIVSDD